MWWLCNTCLNVEEKNLPVPPLMFLPRGVREWNAGRRRVPRNEIPSSPAMQDRGGNDAVMDEAASALIRISPGESGALQIANQSWPWRQAAILAGCLRRPCSRIWDAALAPNGAGNLHLLWLGKGHGCHGGPERTRGNRHMVLWSEMMLCSPEPPSILSDSSFSLLFLPFDPTDTFPLVVFSPFNPNIACT